MKLLLSFILVIASLIAYAQKIDGIKQYKIGIYTSVQPSESEEFNAKNGYVSGTHYETMQDTDISFEDITLHFYHDTLYRIYVPYPYDEFIRAIELKYGKSNIPVSSGLTEHKKWINGNIVAEYVATRTFRDFEIVNKSVQRRIKAIETKNTNKKIKDISNKL